jgi:hypothetical protein
MNGLQGTAAYGQAINASQVGYNAINAPPPDTIMINANRSARATSDELANLCMRLENLKGRLFGLEPAPPAGKDGTAPMPQGAVYELAAEFDRHQSLVNRLMGITTDLERLA